MHHVNDAIVRGGRLVLTDLPFAEGQRVRVDVVEVDETARRSIDDVRRELRGGVERFDKPFEPMIPVEDWEMLK